MRIRRLDLVRYGRFTDTALDLPVQTVDMQVDMHIVIGPNEAGKSTVRSALGDLLFGIPARSEFNFLHDYRSMRLGAVLEASGEHLEVRRRKGTQNTLLTADDTPLPLGEHALAPFLANANREFFERMFSLDHERLRRGGREILEDRDEAASVLFAAGSAVQGLQKRLRALEDEAGGLWGKRRAAGRKYYQAHDRLKKFGSDLRENTVSPAKWRELEREVANRQEDFDKCHDEVDDLEKELRKISRIRRVARHIAQLNGLHTKIAALGEVAPLPDDAPGILEEAEQQIRQLTPQLKEQQEDLATAKQARAALTWDESFVLRAADIDQLHEERIQLRSERIDLPKRQTELALEERKMQELATELAWPSGPAASLAARIPNRTRVARARSLLKEEVARRTSVEAALQSLDAAKQRSQDAQLHLSEIGDSKDVSSLSAVIAEVGSDVRDIEFGIQRAEADAADAEAESQQHYQALNPRPPSIEAVLSVPLPPVATVQSFRDRQFDLDQRKRSCEERIRLAKKDVAKGVAARDHIIESEHPVSEDELRTRREKRDAGWLLIRKRYLATEDVSEAQLSAFTGGHDSIAAAYEEAVQSADDTADRRFQKAEVAARFSELKRTLGERQRVLEDLQEDLSGLAQEADALSSSWRDLWANTSLDPLSPDAMAEWLGIHAQLRASEAKRAKAKRDLNSLRRRESEMVGQLASELRALEIDENSINDLSLRTLLQRASDFKTSQERVAATRVELTGSQRRAAAEMAAANKKVEVAQAEESEWRSRWTVLLGELGIDASLPAGGVEQLLTVIDDMRAVAATVSELRDKRVSKIERDIREFEHSVRTLVDAVAPELADRDADDTVIELKRRLRAVQQARKDANAKDEEIAKRQERIRNLERRLGKSDEDIRRLQESAGVSDTDALREQLEKARQFGQCREEQAQVLERIEKDGDGLPIDVLAKDCEGIDLDEAALQENRLHEEARQARERLTTARDALREARESYESIGGGAAAANAESARQGALAEIGEIAEQYVRARTAASLLRWAVERNRREKQGPLLREAAKLFGELTSGSFENLEIDFDSQDRARLVGRRLGGERVDVSGMSDGTTDQLYLALRIAALGQYLETAQPLPFVADDLFINFDDERAKAGFRALSRLAEKCQVIFFTHHEHLRGIARSALGAQASVIDLK